MFIQFVSIVIIALVHIANGCGTIFVITSVNQGDLEADYGTYHLRNGTQIDSGFRYSSDITRELERQFDCTTIVLVVTDYMLPLAWMNRECVDRLESSDCWVYQRNKELVRLDSIELDSPRIMMVEPTETPTTSPTAAVTTSSPTRSLTCEERKSRVQCETAKCVWLGVLIACQQVDFCGFSTLEACLTRSMYCKWKGNKCLHKK